MSILSPEHRIADHGPFVICADCDEETHEDETVCFGGDDYCEFCWERKLPRLMDDFVADMADAFEWPRAPQTVKEAA